MVVFFSLLLLLNKKAHHGLSCLVVKSKVSLFTARSPDRDYDLGAARCRWRNRHLSSFSS